MAQAAKDMDEKKEKDLFDAQLKKKIILKKKSDKEYEAYWSKQKGAQFDNPLHCLTLFCYDVNSDYALSVYRSHERCNTNLNGTDILEQFTIEFSTQHEVSTI